MSASAQSPPDWVVVSDAMNGINFRMPGQPEKKIDTANAVTRFEYTSEAKTPRGVFYGLAWQRYRQASWDLKALVDQNVKDFLSGYGEGIRVVSSRPRDYRTQLPDLLNPAGGKQTFPGVEARLEAPDGARGMLGVYADKLGMRTFAMAYMVGAAAKYSEADANRFFESLNFSF